MISLDRFILLSLVERLNYVFNHGNEIFCKTEGDFLVRLYAMDAIFVEVWFKTSRNKIEKVVALNEEQVLCGYSHLIDISELSV